MNWLFSSFAAIGGLVPIIVIVGFFFFIKQKKGQENTIPPFDSVDAMKLDKMVSKQVDIALVPILRAEGHSQEKMKKILTRTSFNASFKR